MRARHLGAAARDLARRPGHSLSVAATLATAVAVSLPASLLVRIESWVPLRLAPGLRAAGPPPLSGGISWGNWVRSPARLRTEELEGLAVLLLVLAAAVLATCAVALAVLVARHLTGRRRTFAVRRAVGATPSDLRRELAAEAALLLLFGAAVGGAAGGVATALLPGLTPELVRPVGGFLPRPGVAAVLAGLPVSTVVLGYGVAGPGVALGAPLLGGRAEPVLEGLARPRTPTRWERGSGAAMVALLLVLLTGSFLLFLAGEARPVGGALSLPGGGETSTASLAFRKGTPVAERSDAIRRLSEELRQVVGPGGAGVASAGALLGLGTRAPLLCRGCQRGPVPTPVARVRPRVHAVGPGWLRAAGAKLLAGRPLPDRRGEAAGAAVVNRAFAARFGARTGTRLKLPGRRFDRPWLRVVGVVENLQAPGLGSPASPVPAVYLSALAFPPDRATLVWRGSAAAHSDSGRVPDRLRDVGLADVGSRVDLVDRLARHREPEERLRGAALVLALLAWGTALFGFASVTVLSLRRRWRELGIRRAAGAAPAEVVSLVLRDELRSVAVGGAIGAVLVTVEARAITGWMPGTGSAESLVAFSLSLVTLALTATAAAWLPLRRAIGRPPREMITEG